jgi:radical SAM/Cys-rich protein
MANSRFQEQVRSVTHEPLRALDVKVLQVNMGYCCNMACSHCHVSAGPGRTEAMDQKTADAVLGAFLDNPIETLDITGGAPEINPYFRSLVMSARKAGRRVIARTNLTIFSETGMEGLPEFYHEQGVELIASMPCYLEDNVTAIRGKGAFQKSIDALRRLNSLGFGSGGAGRSLSLVYNPGGAFLSPPQVALEGDYKRELKNRYNVSFTRLYAFTNMPIGRFRDSLIRSGTYDQYLDMLASAFNPFTLGNIMCRNLVSVGWDGRLYDCDFNQVLHLAVNPDAPQHVSEFDHQALSHRPITVDDHCFGCTAGQGSS